MQRNFHELLQNKWNEGKMICVGLDTDISKIPDFKRVGNSIRKTLFRFNKSIIDATKDLVAAYKPNTAFYEQYGEDGWAALRKTISYIHEVAPSVVVICDAKRGDIGNTNDGYAKAVFLQLKADAITISPYMGKEANEPFLQRVDKGIIILCRTSNPGAGEFQDLPIAIGKSHVKSLYEIVAENVSQEWNYNNNCLLVVGATFPGELGIVREIVGDMGILVPGVGKQGGDLKAVLQNGLNSKGQGLIINSSREVLYASKEADFAEAARAVVIRMNNEIASAVELVK